MPTSQTTKPWHASSCWLWWTAPRLQRIQSPCSASALFLPLHLPLSQRLWSRLFMLADDVKLAGLSACLEGDIMVANAGLALFSLLLKKQVSKTFQLAIVQNNFTRRYIVEEQLVTIHLGHLIAFTGLVLKAAHPKASNYSASCKSDFDRRSIDDPPTMTAPTRNMSGRPLSTAVPTSTYTSREEFLLTWNEIRYELSTIQKQKKRTTTEKKSKDQYNNKRIIEYTFSVLLGVKTKYA